MSAGANCGKNLSGFAIKLRHYHLMNTRFYNAMKNALLSIPVFSVIINYDTPMR
jgi:hypothetical protein